MLPLSQQAPCCNRKPKLSEICRSWPTLSDRSPEDLALVCLSSISGGHGNRGGMRN